MHVPTGSALRILGWIALMVILALAPWVFEDFRLFQFSMVAIFAIAVLGLNILTGYNGQFSLGHAAFFAIGAYTTATMMYHWSVPYWITIPFAGLIAGVFGFLFGIPALRLTGLYLALATFALTVATPQILTKWSSLTQGVQGINLVKPAAPFNLALTPDQWLFYFSTVWTLVLFLLARNVLRGRAGRAFKAIRDSEIAAASSGVPVARYKMLAFGLSSFYAGIAGGLYTTVVAYVAPGSFPVTLSINFFLGMVIGGVASIPGSVLGAFVIEFLPEYAQKSSLTTPFTHGPIPPGLVFGIVLILFMYLMPTGIVGLLMRLWRRVSSFFRKRAAPIPVAVAEAAVEQTEFGTSSGSFGPGKEVRPGER